MRCRRLEAGITRLDTDTFNCKIKRIIIVHASISEETSVGGMTPSDPIYDSFVVLDK